MMNSPNPQNPYAPPVAQVGDITEAVQPAGRGARLGAALLDALAVFIAYLPVMVSMVPVMGLIMQSAAQGTPVDSATVATMMVGTMAAGWGLLTVVLLIALLVVTIILVHRNGQTIGKKLLGIKVVRTDGSRASLGRIFWLRNVVNVLPSLIPVVGGFYTIVDHLFIFGEKRQCLHDKIAGTIVVTA